MANLGTLRPGSSFVASVRTYTMVKNVPENYSRFRENRGKRFSFGAIFPSKGGTSCRKEKFCHIWEQE